MRTPDEIKKALKYCAASPDVFSCDGCPFCDQCASGMADTLSYIKRLETERYDLLKIVHSMRTCSECKYNDLEPEQYPCKVCGILCRRWEWRGIQDENA